MHRGGKCHRKARGQSCLGSQLWLGLLRATQLLLGQQVAGSILRGPLGLGTKATSSKKHPPTCSRRMKNPCEAWVTVHLHGVVCTQNCSLSQSDKIWNFSRETPRETTRTRGINGGDFFLPHPARAPERGAEDPGGEPFRPKCTFGGTEYERIST